MPIIVAHRAGNDPSTARPAAARADMVELDAHVRRRRVEVRHAKVLWPTARLWERWYLLPRGTSSAQIGEVLAALPPDTPLLLDLKCFTRPGGTTNPRFTATRATIDRVSEIVVATPRV